MTEKEKQEAEKAIATKLITNLNKMFEKKGINAKVGGANTDNDMLYLTLLIDIPNSDRIAKAEIILAKGLLLNRNSCDIVDMNGGYDQRRLDAATLTLLRIMRIAFDVCVSVEHQKIPAVKRGDNKFKVSFADPHGRVWYY